jgi:uncharacterized paraquat-inducible protein A
MPTRELPMTVREITELMRSWDAATAQHRANAEARRDFKLMCHACEGTGRTLRNEPCLRCNGKGQGPRW